MYTTSATLLARIRNGDDGRSWEEFYARYMPLIYKVARRQGLGDADAEEVVQLVMLGVSRDISRYNHSRGPFRRWLLGVAFKKIVDVSAARGRRGAPVDPADLPANGSVDHPFIREWERQWREGLLQQAVEAVRRDGDDVAFQAFWLRVVQDWPVKEVARALNIRPERVYDYKHRVSRRIAEEYELISRAAGED
jgi:RNA polymerase sigma-70 factor (ECF subfamily)